MKNKQAQETLGKALVNAAQIYDERMAKAAALYDEADALYAEAVFERTLAQDRAVSDLIEASCPLVVVSDMDRHIDYVHLQGCTSADDQRKAGMVLYGQFETAREFLEHCYSDIAGDNAEHGTQEFEDALQMEGGQIKFALCVPYGRRSLERIAA